MLNKFNDNMENNMNDLYEKVMDKENYLRARLSRLNDNVKKINKYEKANTEKN